VQAVLARSRELGPLPPVEEPFDPTQPGTEESPESENPLDNLLPKNE
jgi:hypothetical protein